MRTRPLKVALLGCGVVGSEVARIMTTHADDLAARIGAPVELAGVAVRRPPRCARASTPRWSPPMRPPWSNAATSTSSSRSSAASSRPVRSSPPPSSTARASSRPTRRCSPRTAPPCTPRPRATAGTSTTRRPWPGAIPLVRPLRESLAGDKVNRVLGIVNGTTNFILDRMDTSGAGYSEALDEATALGYAEADPTADVEGFDAAAKAAILAGIAFHTRVTHRRGAPRGHHRGHRRRHRLRPPHGLHRQAPRHLRARRRRRVPSPPACTPR